MNTPHRVYTLGYTGLKPNHLLETATHLDAIIADIRISPRSRHPQWDGNALHQLLGGRYIHLGKLGNKNYKRPELGIELVDVEAGTIAAAHLLAKQPIILLCACPDWQHCHRRIAAEELKTRYDVEVIHLSPNNLTGEQRPTPPEPPKQMSFF